MKLQDSSEKSGEPLRPPTRPFAFRCVLEGVAFEGGSSAAPLMAANRVQAVSPGGNGELGWREVRVVE